MSSETQTQVPILRFKFLPETLESLHNFSKIHQYDDRIDFKEAWKDWVLSNQDIVNFETRRLENLGCTKDIETKMFKSARYYLKNKSDVSKEPVQRRNYISMSSHILTLMDEHIQNTININNTEILTPAKSYDKFCESFQTNILTEINRLLNIGISGDDIKLKLKKTFKNRYFRLTSNKNNIVKI